MTMTIVDIVGVCLMLVLNKTNVEPKRIALVPYLYKRGRYQKKCSLLESWLTATDFIWPYPVMGLNTLSHFKTRLHQLLDFTEGEWEVGLSDLLYPTSLENISKDESFLDLLIPFEPQTQKDIEGSNTSMCLYIFVYLNIILNNCVKKRKSVYRYAN